MYILFDIGKTKTRIAGSRDLSTFSEPQILDTPKDYDEMIKTITARSKEIAGTEEIKAIGGGIGAPLDKEHQSLIEDVNFPGWAGKALSGDLWTALNAPVYLENDSACVGLGEAVYGAGKEFDIVAYITISTSVGGVRIVNKRIDANAFGFEPGWQILSPDGKYAADFLGGSSIEKETGKKAFEIDDPNFWDTEAVALAYFLNNVIVMWSPDTVIVGGSMMKDIGIPLDSTKKYLKDILKIFAGSMPPIRKAMLGDVGGLWGAMEFLKSKGVEMH